MEQINNQEQPEWPPPGYTEHFIKRCEIYLNSLSGAAKSFESVTCRPVDEEGIFGWQFEQGVTEHPWNEEGSLEFGLAYLEHMIGQGFYVAYAVSEKDSGYVHLKAWEDEDEEPAWPEDNQIVLFAIWQPMQYQA